jgi:ribosome-binding protein aMBF1 (putative translation factor)
MSIYQDWTPVDIGNKSKINKIQSQSSSKAKAKEEDYDGTPPTILYWTTDLIIALQQLRQVKGLSQKDLAKRMNLPSSMINDIEANKCPYNPTLYKKIFRYMGGDPSSLNFPKVK